MFGEGLNEVVALAVYIIISSTFNQLYSLWFFFLKEEFSFFSWLSVFLTVSSPGFQKI